MNFHNMIEQKQKTSCLDIFNIKNNRMSNHKKNDVMKHLGIALFILFALGTGSSLASNSSGLLYFETISGEVLEMEFEQEQEYIYEIPATILLEISAVQSNPNNHQFFKTLIEGIQKPEREDPLPLYVWC